jgi:glycogen phosphorylase
VPSLSILDGWWREGHVEGVTGWAIGPRDRAPDRSDAQDADELYKTLEDKILPIYSTDGQRWGQIMRSTIALNASVFNTHRMLQEYCVKAYEEQHRLHE